MNSGSPDRCHSGSPDRRPGPRDPELRTSRVAGFRRPGGALPTVAAVLVTLLAAFRAGAITSLGGGAATVGEAGAVVARTVDLDAIGINPAAIVGAEGGELVLGGSLVNGGTQFTPASGRSHMESQPHAFPFPAFSGVFPITETWSVGASLDQPDARRASWPGALADSLPLTRGEFTTAALTAAVGWRRTDHLSVGAGIQFVYEDVLVESGEWTLPEDPTARGRSTFHTDGVGTALICGIAARESDRTVIGFSFRSAGHIASLGSARFDVPAAMSDHYPGGTARAALEVPGVIRFGIAHAPLASWLLEMDAEWTGSRVLRDVAYTVGNSDSLQHRDFGWRDAFVLRAGTDWHPTPAITLRAGYAWDHSLASGATPSLLLPGDVEHTVSAGVGMVRAPYRADVALAWSRRAGTSAAGSGVAAGELATHTVTAALTLRYRFARALP